MEHDFVLLAGDARQRALLKLLQSRGESAVHLSSCRSADLLRSEISAAKTVVLPVAMSRDGVHLRSSGEECLLLSDVFAALKNGQRVFGGGFSAEQLQQAETRGARAFDFLKDEAFALKNAALTAQGALRLMLENLSVSLQGLPVLITGFGRIGKATGALLKNTGCRVSVAARSEIQRTEASLSGLNALPLSLLKQALHAAAVIVNTVPAPLFGFEELQHCKENAIFLELASAPFGAKEGDVRAFGLHYLPGGGLPGRFCPDACAEAMLSVIDQPAKGVIS